MAVRTGPQPMPGMMPQMPGIMGAPMGPPPGMPPMGGMPGMPPMPMGGMPPPMPMPMGGPAPGPQGGRPASLGTLPAPSTAAQRAGFGAAVGSVMGRPVPGSMPADVFASGIPGGMMDASIPRPVAMMRDGGVARMQDGGLVVQKNADGTASILFPGGGIHTVRGSDPVKALQQAYGSRISSVTSSNLTASELAAQQREIRVANQLATVAATLENRPKYAGGADTGFDPNHVSSYLESMSGQIAAPDTSADRYVAEAASKGAKYLSRYLPPEQVAGMTQRQLLAANELMTQGGGVKASNYLSNEDLDFILNKANDFQGAVWSPVGQAISLGAGSGEASRYSGPQVSSGVTSGGAQPSGGNGRTFVAPSPIVAEPVPVSQPGGGIMNALPGEVIQTVAGPMMGSVYQPTVSEIPTFVGGASDVFGTRPVTYVTSPQATIRSRLGEIDLPARPESVNVVDWLQRPVAMMRDGGVAYMQDGGDPLTAIQRSLRGTYTVGQDESGNFVVRTPSGGVIGHSYSDPAMAERMSRALEAGKASMTYSALRDIAPPSAAEIDKLRSEGFSSSDIDAAIASQIANRERARVTLARMLEDEAQKAGLGVSDVYSTYSDILGADVLGRTTLTAENLASMASSAMPERVSFGPSSVPVGGSSAGGQGYVAEPVPVSQPVVSVSQPGGGIMNAVPGDVMGTFAGPMMGSVYQPTVGQIPTFVSGVSDVFGTHPVTYVGSPQATIGSRLGEIDLPARPQSINVFDWLGTPVAGYGGFS